jgi:S-DNA-T family DNA segregation ATPase FtsK/SpoIIIE
LSASASRIDGMEIELTVVDPTRTGARADVAVRAGAGTTLAAVADRLRDEVAHLCAANSCHCEFVCDDEVLDLSRPLGLPPLLHGAMLVLRPPGRATGRATAPAAAPALLAVHVVAGPAAGTVVPLPPGRAVVGRDGAAVRLTDAGVSRAHAELALGPGGATVRDLDSSNGTRLGRRRVGPVPEPVQPEEEVRVGTSSLVLRSGAPHPASVRPDAAGHLLVQRAPDLVTDPPEVRFGYPPRPGPAPATRTPWITALLPLLIAVPMAVVWHQPVFLLFALMTPVMMAGQAVHDRRSGRREARLRLERHERRRTEIDGEVAAAIAADAAARSRRFPDLALLATAAAVPTPQLWNRRPTDAEFLGVRLGLGRWPAGVLVDDPDERPAEGGGRESPPARHREHERTPVTLDLTTDRVIGIVGPRRERVALAQALVGQVACLHSPEDVRIIVLTAPEPDGTWAWARWLPHRTGGGTGTGGSDAARTVVVLDDAGALRDRPDVAAALQAATPIERGPASRQESGAAAVICLDRDPTSLPAEATAVVHLEVDDRSRVTARLRRRGHRDVTLVPDLAARGWAARLGRHLARLRDSAPAPGTSLPARTDLLDLLATDGLDATTPRGLAAHWTAEQGPVAVLGQGPDGPVRVDLRADGPHALVGGTTGAGKSELLLTLVTSLAVAEPPDRITFLLVDYKGGAAFARITGLPHVTGLITDLDRHLARRALISLRAELRARERLLHAAGAADVDAYAALRRREPDRPPLPRLVVVVDEFRVLAEELPEFVDGLVRTATVGRSLGVHLVLATQRPAGAVSAQIRANVNLRIALRVTDAADSLDLIDVPAAAVLPASAPGRALVRSGSGRPVELQSALVTGATGEGSATPSVVRAGAPFPAAPVGEISDLDRIRTALREAAAGRPGRVAPAWLPPLADRVGPEPVLGRRAGDVGVVLGLADDPADRRQAPARWHLDGHHLAIAGGPRSGRTTAVRAIAVAAGRLSTVPDVYAWDAAGTHRDLERLPWVGAVIDAQDVERGRRLLDLLERRIRTGPRPADPPVVLLIDGWETLWAALSTQDHGRPADDLLTALRDGPAAGVVAAVAGGRAVLTGQVSSLLSRRLVLRFADPADRLLAGVPAPMADARQPPGRALLLGPGTAAAVGAAGRDELDTAGVEVQITCGTALPASIATGGRQTPPVPELPTRLAHADLMAEIAGSHPGTADTPRIAGVAGVAIGLGGPDVTVQHLPLGRDRLALVLGPPGSGRSCALRLIAAGLERSGRRSVLIGAPGAGGPGATGPQDSANLAERLRADPGTVVLVDDAAVLDDALADVITAHAQAGPGRVVAAATAGEVLGAYSGLLSLGRPAASGLLLGPVGPADGEALGVRIAAAGTGREPPGRGLLVVRGRVRTVQVSLPPPEHRSDEPTPSERPIHRLDGPMPDTVLGARS